MLLCGFCPWREGGGHRDEIHKVLFDRISIGWEGGVTSSLPNQQGFLNVSISKDKTVLARLARRKCITLLDNK